MISHSSPVTKTNKHLSTTKNQNKTKLVFNSLTKYNITNLSVFKTNNQEVIVGGVFVSKFYV